jgi:ABC-type oligopeptide transport system substrate-binding subunit
MLPSTACNPSTDGLSAWLLGNARYEGATAGHQGREGDARGRRIRQRLQDDDQDVVLLSVPLQRRLAVQDQLKQIGITADVLPEDNGTFIADNNSKNYEMLVSGTSGYVDPNDIMLELWYRACLK